MASASRYSQRARSLMAIFTQATTLSAPASTNTAKPKRKQISPCLFIQTTPIRKPPLPFIQTTPGQGTRRSAQSPNSQPSIPQVSAITEQPAIDPAGQRNHRTASNRSRQAKQPHPASYPRNNAFPFNNRTPNQPPHNDSSSAPVNGRTSHSTKSGCHGKSNTLR